MNQSKFILGLDKQKISFREREIKLLQSILTKTKISKKKQRITLQDNLIKETKLPFRNYAKRLVYWLISSYQCTKISQRS